MAGGSGAREQQLQGHHSGNEEPGDARAGGARRCAAGKDAGESGRDAARHWGARGSSTTCALNGGRRPRRHARVCDHKPLPSTATFRLHRPPSPNSGPASQRPAHPGPDPSPAPPACPPHRGALNAARGLSPGQRIPCWPQEVRQPPHFPRVTPPGPWGCRQPPGTRPLSRWLRPTYLGP